MTDGLGSTTAITDGAGTVTGTYTYDAFGSVRSQSGATTERSYTGEQNDPTGLEYLRARYYDASTGRFLSLDPLPLLQRYAYANDNPANFVDPSGLFSAQDTASDVYEIAKQILNDPCWKTQIFCPHPALHWNQIKKVGKKVAPYVRECLSWGTSGALASAITGGGVVAGAAIGCATGTLSYYVSQEVAPNYPILSQTTVQCGIWGAGSFLAASGSGAAYAAGCVSGGMSYLASRLNLDEPFKALAGC